MTHLESLAGSKLPECCMVVRRDMDHTQPSERIKEIDSPEGHQNLIRTQWREFASIAWGRYLSEGRGAVVINLRRGRESGAGLQIPTNYIAEASKRLRDLGGWPDEEITQIIREYVPEQEVVFLFLRLDGDVFHYIVDDDLTPPEAHRAKTAATARHE